MSLSMVDYIVDEHNIDIECESLKKVKVRNISLCIVFKVSTAS